MTAYDNRLEALTDIELSAEWVAVMTAKVEPDNREAQLAAIDDVAEEVNSRYREGGFSSLVITSNDALAVADHLKRLIGAEDSDWFGRLEQHDDG